MEKLKKAPAAADYLGVSLSKLYKMTHYRQLKHQKIFGQLRFKEEDLKEYYEQHLLDVRTKEELEHEAEKIGGHNG